jgi:hypothetical protein
MENKIEALIKRIYKDKKYPDKNIFVLNEEKAKEIFEEIKKKFPTHNVIFKVCPDCDYCYYLLVSKSSDIPLPPEYCRNKKDRRFWITRYGKKYNLMYISLSRLAEYSLIYWSKYSWTFLTESQKVMLIPPDEVWKEIFTKVIAILSELGINTVPPSLVNKRYAIEFDSKISGICQSPTVRDLLFSEEFH